MLFALRLLTMLSGLGLLVFGLGWWVHPAAAAAMLGANLLEGTGRSTQIGDSGAFFIGAGTLLAWGALIAVATFLALLPAFLGLFFVLPLFGHATWHLYDLAVKAGTAEAQAQAGAGDGAVIRGVFSAR